MKDVPARPVDWRSVAVFMLLACAWSWPLFWLRDMHPDAWNALPLPPPLRYTLLMWGPGLAALLCMRIFRHSHGRRTSLFGGQRLRSLAFYFVPMLALAVVGITPPGRPTQHAIVLAIAVVGLLNSVGEELGWRGFLHDALAPLRRHARALVVGLAWSAWHFTNVFGDRGPAEVAGYLAWYLPMTIVLSFALAAAVDRTRAVVAAATLHAWVNVVFEMPAPATFAVLALALPFWGWLLWRWPDAGASTRQAPQGAHDVAATG